MDFEPRFLTAYETECLHEYYFDPDNEVEKNLTEAGFKQWYEDLDWSRIDEIVGSPVSDDNEER